MQSEEEVGITTEEEEEEEISVPIKTELKDLDEKYRAILDNLIEHVQISETRLKEYKGEYGVFLETFPDLKDMESVKKARDIIACYVHLIRDMQNIEKYLIKSIKEKEKKEGEVIKKLKENISKEDLEIYERLRKGEKGGDLAKEYKKSVDTITNIKRRVRIIVEILNIYTQYKKS